MLFHNELRFDILPVYRDHAHSCLSIQTSSFKHGAQCFDRWSHLQSISHLILKRNHLSEY